MAKITRPMVRIHDLATNEIIDREMNDAEFAVYEADKVEYEAKRAEAILKATARADLLQKLGISAEEATLLLS